MIYFLGHEDGTYVKIGHVDDEFDIASRVTDLQIGNPIRLVIIGTIEGDRNDEERLHAKLTDSWVRGEWFKMSRKVRQYLIHCGLKTEYADRINERRRANTGRREGRKHETARKNQCGKPVAINTKGKKLSRCRPCLDIENGKGE